MTIKGLLLLLLISGFLTSCGQRLEVKNELNLKTPRETNEAEPTAEDFRHSVELTREQAILTLDGNKQLVSYNLLSEVFEKKKANIKRKVFSIIAVSETPYKTVVDVLDMLDRNNVDRYKLFNAMDQVDQPDLKADLVYADSSFLKIEVLEKGYKTELLKVTAELLSITALDRYLSNHKEHIDGNRVCLYGPAELPFQSFKPLLDVLKKHQLYGFKIITRK